MSRIVCSIAVFALWIVPLAQAQQAPNQPLELVNSNVMLEEAFSVPDKPAAPEPIEIVAARNGSFSGTILATSKGPIEGLSASISDFRHADGKATIPAASVRIRYAVPDNVWQNDKFEQYPTIGFRGFDGLFDKPRDVVPVIETVDPRARRPFGRAVQPIWLTVKVDPQAATGLYTATLTVSAGRKKAQVPVKLTVYGYKLPDSRQWTTLVDLVQSPETIAMTYETPLWSDEHFAKLENSIRLLAEAGDRTAYVHLTGQTNHFNGHTMVIWKPKADGTYSYDFSPMNRYLALVKKHYGTIDVVCLYLWDAWMEGGDHRSLEYWKKTGQTERIEAWEKNHGGGPVVSTRPLVSAEDGPGKLKTISLPPRTTPEGKVIWKDFSKALLAELAKQGYRDNLTLGMLGDQVPPQPVLDALQKAMPGIDWVKQSHSMKVYNANAKETDGWDVRFAAFVWGAQVLHPDKLRHGWQDKGEYKVSYPRGIHTSSPTLTYRHLGEMNIGGEQRGFGRIGADFWPVMRNARGALRGDIVGRFPHAVWKNLDIKVSLLAAGPEGAVATRRYEMMREGLQECEARIFIDRALVTPALRAKLGPQLAGECEKVLLARNAAILKGFNITQPDEWRDFYGWKTESKTRKFNREWYANEWQKLSHELFTTAEKVAQKIGQPQE
jgi:hypothetical protein